MFPELAAWIVNICLRIIGKAPKAKAQRAINWCDGNGHRIVTLDCGCMEIFHLDSFDEASHLVKCECGKHHQVRTEETEYRDCLAHVEFFRRWPEARRGYFYGECPQLLGLKSFKPDPHDADVMLYRACRRNASSQHLGEICKFIFPSSYYSMMTLTELGNQLPSELQDSLARHIWRWQHIMWLLEKPETSAFLKSKTLARLKLIAVGWGLIFWLLRFAALVAVSLTWRWHAPDWKTVTTLAVTGAGIAIIIWVKKWLKE